MRLIDHLTKEQRRALYGRRNHTACVRRKQSIIEEQQRGYSRDADREIARLMRNR